MTEQTPERGRFITVEGVEGAGKSTCVSFIRSRLEAAGRRVLPTREPGGTPLGEEIRALLLAHRDDGMSDDAELLLVFAARAEHIARCIQPALEAGRWVLSDRFTDATFAYQGGGRGIARERIGAIRDWVQGDLAPDLTLVLDLPARMGLQRAGRRSSPDRFERETERFFERVRTAYRKIADEEPARVRLIDASLPLEEVHAQIARTIEAFLAQP
jgi:dTMP kinase